MTERLSVIAGSGALVPEVLAAARARGWAVQVLALTRRFDLAGFPVVRLEPGRPQQAIDAIGSFGATRIAMAGAVRLSDRDREALARFAGVTGAAVGDTGLSAISATITERTGAKVIGVHEIAPDLLAPAGRIAGPDAPADLTAAAEYAVGLARRAGRLDLGQGLVVSGRRPVASEDVGGTDALLWRVWLYRLRGLIADGESRLVLAKASKPDQPRAIDLPAIGPATIGRARRAGIAIIAVEAGGALLIDRPRLFARAAAAGMPIVGIAVSDA